MRWRDGVIDALHDGLAVLDRSLVVLAWNRAMAALTSCPSSTAVGRPLADACSLASTPSVAHAINRALGGEQTRVDAVEVPGGAAGTAGGRARWFEVQCAPWRDADGSVGGATLRVSDVTETRRQAAFTSALEAVAHALTSTLDLDTVLDVVAARARAIMEADAALVVGWDGAAPRYTIMRAAGRLSGEYAAVGWIQAGRGPISLAVQEARPFTTSNILTDPAFDIPAERRQRIAIEGFKAVAAVPLVAKGRVHGALVVHYWTERLFAYDEIDALAGLAEQAALAIDTARLYADARRRAARLGELVGVTQSMSASLDTADVIQRIAQAAADLSEGSTAILYVHDAERDVLRHLAVAGGEVGALPAEVPATAGLHGLAFTGRRPVFIESPVTHPQTLMRDWWRARPGATYYAVPIVFGDTVFGVLGCVLASRTPSLEERETLQLLATHAGIAMRNAARYEAERLQAERIRALADVNRRISGALELDDLLKRIAESAASLTGVRYASFWVVDPSGQTLMLTEGSDPRMFADFGARALSFEQGAAGWTARHRRPLVIDDVFQDSRVYNTEWWRRWGLRSLATHPVLAGDELLAVLVLSHTEPVRIGGEARGMIDLFVAQAAIAIKNARLYREARRRRDTAEAIARLGRELTATLDIGRIAAVVARGAGDLLEPGSAAVYRCDAADDSLHLLGAFGPQGAAIKALRLRPREGVAGRAVVERRLVSTPDVLNDPAIELSAESAAILGAAGVRAIVAVPLIAHDRVVGALGVGFEAGRSFTDDDLEVLQALADQAALALANARLYAESERERREAAALARAARRLARSLDVDEVGRELVETVRELFAAHASALYRAREDGAIESVAFAGPARDHMRAGAIVPRGAGLIGRTIEERRPTWSLDVLRDPSLELPPDFRAAVAATGNRAVLAVPLVAKNEVIGALGISDRVSRGFDAREVSLLQAFADQAALALENARLYASARDSLARLRETQAQLVQAAKMSAVGQLVSGVAHELNNPLAVVIGYGQLLLAREIPPHLRRPIELMVAQGDRMAKIVRNLLLFARQRPPERVSVHLHQVLEQTLALRLSHLTLSGIAVTKDFAADLPVIAGDAHQLQQVFLNLLLNAEQAIEETARGAGTIVLRTRVMAGGAAVRAEVTDDGAGIRADVLARVFEPFFTTKAVGAGTGLGLSVSYGIVQEHGGRLTVESAAGLTTFAVDLPVSSPAVAEPVAVIAPPLRVEGRRALVVEDEPSVLELVVELLEETGWRVDVASGGAGGLERLRATRYDLIVSDMRMADGSGEVLYRGAITLDGALASRFIFITGDTANPDVWRFLQDTGAPVVEKPFKAATFLEVVRRAVNALTPSISSA